MSSRLELVRWLGSIAVVLAPLTAWEAFLGHYRSGFSLKAQYAPLVTAMLLVGGGAFAVVSPGQAGEVLQIAGWAGVLSGAIGTGFHHYYGITEKPGGYRWLLHQVMIHAPPLAPLSQAALGALLILAGHVAGGATAALGIPVTTWLVEVCAVAITGAVVQSAILHYRGAFNNPLMYVPVTLPLAAAAVLAWQGYSPSSAGARIATVAMWMTFLIGFIGVGMHVRGIDRQMGGFYVGMANLMQGPPLTAPLAFSGFAAAALAAMAYA